MRLKAKNGQAVVHAIGLDVALRTAVSHRKGPEDVMEYERFKSYTNHIEAANRATKVGKGKGEDGDQDDNDNDVQTRTGPAAASSSTGRQSEDGGAGMLNALSGHM